MNTLFDSSAFVANEKNDLVCALKKLGYLPKVFDTVNGALNELKDNGVLFILAQGYTDCANELSTETVNEVRKKHAKIFIEYPQSILNAKTESPKGIVYERMVISSPVGTLKSGDILMNNGCRFRSFFKDDSTALIKLAKVAGYDTIQYGMPDNEKIILGFLDNKNDVLISTTVLSNFITARHNPKVRWKALWQGILELLGIKIPVFDYEETVSLTYSPNEALASNAPQNAWERNIKWIKDYMIDYSYKTPMVLEGFASAIDENGNQAVRRVFRGDCTGEVAMELALGGNASDDKTLTELAFSVMDTLFTPELFYNDDPRSSAYGHINWFENGKVFYGDDNARALLGALSVRAVTGNTRWDEQILRAVFANLRTSDKYGVRCPRLDTSSFKDATWLDYYNGTMEYISPHYQSYLYAVFLWAYELTGIEELLTKSISAIEKTMALFPDKLRWQNSLTGEITRMLLPLSILARIDPSKKHIDWLEYAVNETLKLQEACGAVREIFGDMSLGKYPPPSSNESYGTTEASLIQNNGDPATDLLYALNWAFIGLWEAYLVLKKPSIKNAYLKLKDFMLRIQLKSEKHPEFDGAWMRSFDYNKWEYWGSASDIGWSAWSIETGWTNAWIAATLILEAKNESLFSTDHKEELLRIAPDIYKEMFTFIPTTSDGYGKVASMDGSAE